MDFTTEMIEGQVYQIGRLSPMKSFHVVRRLAPLMAKLGETANEIKNLGTLDLLPIADALSKMSDTETEYIINQCLAVCKRRTEASTWSNIMSGPGNFLYDDITMETMVSITIKVIEVNLLSFFSITQQSSPTVG